MWQCRSYEENREMWDFQLPASPLLQEHCSEYLLDILCTCVEAHPNDNDQLSSRKSIPKTGPGGHKSYDSVGPLA